MLRTTSALVAAAACATAASAHHGFGSFDLNRDLTIEGTLAEIDFVNPHSWLYIDAVDTAGETMRYRCEMRGATVLRRSGWSKEMFEVGAQITVTGAPDRRDPNSCYLGTVTFPDGSQMDRYGQRSEAPVAVVADHPARTADGAPNLAGDWATEQLVMTDPRGIVGGLAPLSVVQNAEPGEAVAAPFPGSRGADPSLRSFSTVRVPLTPVGQAAVDGYEDFSADNPRLRCESTSIIFDWSFDGMVHRVEQTPETITLRYGQYDLVRTVHLDQTEHPVDLAPTHEGHSIGRWDGDVLVVDTIGFTPGILSPPLHHGEKLHIVERYTLDAEAGTLRRDYEATDPDHFIGSYTGGEVVRLSGLPFSPDPCEDTSLLDYSQEVEDGAEAAPEQ